MKGIDLSSNNGPVDFVKAYADGVGFCYVKLTEGTNYVNPKAHEQITGALSAGMRVGGYHFAQPDQAPGADQAAHYISVRRGYDHLTLPDMLDLEAGTGNLGTFCAAFLGLVEAAFGVPGIYVSPAFWREHVPLSGPFGRNPLWLAHYTTGAPDVPAPWTHYTYWQYTSTGRIAGYSGDIDLSTEEDFLSALTDAEQRELLDLMRKCYKGLYVAINGTDQEEVHIVAEDTKAIRAKLGA